MRAGIPKDTEYFMLRWLRPVAASKATLPRMPFPHIQIFVQTKTKLKTRLKFSEVMRRNC